MIETRKRGIDPLLWKADLRLRMVDSCRRGRNFVEMQKFLFNLILKMKSQDGVDAVWGGFGFVSRIWRDSSNTSLVKIVEKFVIERKEV